MIRTLSKQAFQSLLSPKITKDTLHFNEWLVLSFYPELGAITIRVPGRNHWNENVIGGNLKQVVALTTFVALGILRASLMQSMVAIARCWGIDITMGTLTAMVDEIAAINPNGRQEVK